MKGCYKMKENKLEIVRRIEASVLLALVISMVLSFTGFCRECGEVRENVLRLHVIANSDSESDQQLKLRVRDAVLTRGSEIFDGSVTAETAKERIVPRISELEKTANEVIRKSGCKYTAKIIVGKEYFETRAYGDMTMPAGVYTAVRVIIGEGDGKNWWCVMFPPLCLPAAQQNAEIDACLDGGAVKVVKGGEKYEVRFKAVEIIEKVKQKLR